jgi:ubiquinone/menaquinone biosynthesis C-methylase UbiE
LAESDPLPISEDFDCRAERYESQSFWSTDEYIASHAIELLKNHQIGDLLDAGGGTGALSRFITKSFDFTSALVVDPSGEMLTRVPSHIQTNRASIEDFDPLNRQFDTILLRQVLHYTDTPREVLEKLKTILRKNGRLYIGQIVAPDNSSSQLLNSIGQQLSPNRKRVWTLEGLLTFALSGGLQLVEARLHSFRDDLRSWISRRVVDVDEDQLVDSIRASLSPQLRSIMGMKERRNSLSFEIIWCHALFKAD